MRTYTDVMLFVEATGVTTEELAELRANHDIVARSGEPMLLKVRKVEQRIVWSIERMKKDVQVALRAETQQEAETLLATVA